MRKMHTKKIYWGILIVILLFNISPVLSNSDTAQLYNNCVGDCDRSDPTVYCYELCQYYFPQGHLQALQEANQALRASRDANQNIDNSPVVEIQSTKPLGAKTFLLNVQIGKVKSFTIAPNSNPLGEYIKLWYGFLLGVIGIMATGMIMWGGFKYLTSRGDKGVIDTAKTQIISAITGVVLAFGSYTLLSIINPALLTINMPGLPRIQGGGNVNLGDSHANATTVQQAGAGPGGQGGGSGGSSSDINSWTPQNQPAVTTISQNPNVLRTTTYAGHDDATQQANMAVDVWPSPGTGDDVATYLMNNAASLNIKYIIWEQHKWNPSIDGAPIPLAQWRGMEDRGSPTQNHMDHIHVSFNQ